MESFPLVSICSTTYNLEKYISEALVSWLSQVTTFPFEIVICDDCSKDKTVFIIEKYVAQYPDIIRLLTTDKNMGMMPNYIRSLKAAKGKYIAVCDGDDYWIDSNKLQMQIDFLESNTDFIACLTNSYVISESTGEKKLQKNKFGIRHQVKNFSIMMIFIRIMLICRQDMFQRTFLEINWLKNIRNGFMTMM